MKKPIAALLSSTLLSICFTLLVLGVIVKLFYCF